jgi:ligand-binding sensor domain-containing protein
MPQGSAISVAQSNDGFLWVGTQRGLTRFDGKRFVMASPGIDDLALNPVWALVAAQGSIWAATPQAVYQVAGLRQARKLEPETHGRGCGRQVSVLFADPGQSLLVGSNNGSVCQWRNEAWAPVGPASNQAPVNALARSATGSLWVGTAEGLWRQTATGDWLPTAGLPTQEVTSLQPLRSGGMAVGTVAGLVVLDDRHPAAPPFRQQVLRGVVAGMVEDRDANLWVATWPDGLLRLTPQNTVDRFADGLLARTTVEALHEDRDGNLWIGTDSDGLIELSATGLIPFSEPEGLDDQLVWSVLETRDGSVWMSTRKGLRRLANGRTPAPVPPSLAGVRTGALLEAENGDLWVGIAGGLARVTHGQVQQWRLATNPDARVITVLTSAGDGQLWVGTTALGLFQFAGGRFTEVPGFRGRQITAIHQSRSGKLWVACAPHGLHVREATGWRKVPLPDAFVLSILETNDGGLWLGTSTQGLFRVRNNQVAAVGPDQGLFSRTVYSLVPDAHGRIWMGSIEGIGVAWERDLNAAADGQLRRIHSPVFGPERGARHAEFSGGVSPAAWRSRDGRLWFPSKGLTAVDPAAVFRPYEKPRLFVDSAESLPGQPVAAVLPVGQRDAHFRLTAPFFARSGQLRTQYRLAGYDQHWQDGLDQEIRYTNLPPAHYRLEARIETDDGQWTPPELLHEFSVPPRFTETGAFVLLLLTAAAGLTVIAAQWRTRHLKHREQELQRLVEARTAEATAATRAKSEFLANMSHELRTPMHCHHRQRRTAAAHGSARRR